MGGSAPFKRTFTAPPHACNRHSVIRHCGVRRGFLPRGLFNTRPSSWRIVVCVARGQVSNKPKRLQSVAADGRAHADQHQGVIRPGDRQECERRLYGNCGRRSGLSKAGLTFLLV